MSTPAFATNMPVSFTHDEKDQLMKDELTFIANNMENPEALKDLKVYLECLKLVYELKALRPHRRLA